MCSMSDVNERLYAANVVMTLAGVSARQFQRDVKDGFITPAKKINNRSFFMLKYARWRREYPKLTGFDAEKRAEIIAELRKSA